MRRTRSGRRWRARSGRGAVPGGRAGERERPFGPWGRGASRRRPRTLGRAGDPGPPVPPGGRARPAGVSLPDPSDPARSIEIELAPGIKPQANAARYFKRAARAQRGLVQIPPRIAAVEAELRELDALLERASAAEATAGSLRPGADPKAEQEADEGLEQDLEQALAGLPPGLRGTLHPRAVRPAVSRTRAHDGPHKPAAPHAEPRAPSARLQPRRLRSAEGWEVMIGR